jgi:parallel beta-helix repeat protein
LLRKAVSGITLTLLIMSMLTLAFNIQPVKAEPKTWTVDDDGPADFHTIQEAINAANPGDTIFVKTGTYYENVVANKSVLLIGEDPTKTIVDGGGRFVKVVEIMANNVAIQNFTIRNSNQMPGWWENNLIFVYKINSTLIQSNIITSPAGKAAGIVLINSSGNIISGNNITANYNMGIRLWDSSNNTISRNNITRNSTGIELDEESSNNTITENSVSDHIGCIGSSNIISRNIVTGSISLYGSSNTISENIITARGWGVTLYGYGHNISKNTISASQYDGIIVYSHNCSIYANTLTDNGQAGITIEISSSYNKFYHNNLINNTRNVLTVAILGKPPMPNTWDDGYPSGGNYWSDYTGVDANGDGIGDSPRGVYGNNTDRYPLMKPWSPSWTGAVETPRFPIDPTLLFVAIAIVIVIVIAIFFMRRKKKPTEAQKPAI